MQYIVVYFNTDKENKWKPQSSHLDINLAYLQKRLCEVHNPPNYRFLVVEERADLTTLPPPVY